MSGSAEVHTPLAIQRATPYKGDSMSDDDLLRAAKRSGLLDYFNDSGLDTVMSGELAVIRRFLELATQPAVTVPKPEMERAVEKKIAPPARVARTWVDV